MKKKFLSFILALCLIIPATFMFTACSTTEDDNVQIRVQDGYVQWSSDDSDWKNVITIDEILDAIGDDITGPQGEQGQQGIQGPQGEQGVAGKQVEFNVSTTHIQWRYVGDSTWNNLIALEDIKGEQGDDGDDGKDASVVEYTITYDYNNQLDMSELMTNYATSQKIKSNQWLTNMPYLENEELDGYFLGWYIKGTDKQIENYDFIGGDVILEARWKENFTLNCLGFEYNQATSSYIATIDAKKEIVIIPNTYNDSTNGEHDVLKIKSNSQEEGTNILKQVVLPSTLKTIISGCFNNCKNLEMLDISQTNLSLIEGVDGYLAHTCYNGKVNVNSIEQWLNLNIRENAKLLGTLYINHNLVKDLVIPEGITEIKSYTFEGVGFNSIKLPSTLEYIRLSAFRSTPANSIDFSKCVNLKSIADNAFEMAHNLKILDLSNCVNLVTIKERAFTLNTSLEEVILPNVEIYLENAAFDSCRNLVSINLDMCTEIGIRTFGYCTKLTKVDLSNALRVQNSAFVGCTALTDVIFSNKLQYLLNVAFDECSELSNIYYYGTKEEYSQITIYTPNEEYNAATLYYYIENEQDVPDDEYNYWHYDTDGITPIAW